MVLAPYAIFRAMFKQKVWLQIAVELFLIGALLVYNFKSRAKVNLQFQTTMTHI
jgi:hypothetical protein